MTSKQPYNRDRARWRAPEAVTIALAGVVLTAAVGMVLSRPDVVIVGIVPALWLVHALRAMRRSPVARVELAAAEDAVSSRPTVTVTGYADSDLVELAIVQGRTEPSQLITVPGEDVDATITLLHTGPSELVRVHARALSADGGVIGAVTDPVSKDWALEPVPQPLDGLPLSRRLVGMHGAHQGIRPGRGGDFRDIHPFAPGDEVRRIDWRVTARIARTPGELFIRRTNTLSDAEIVIVADTSADLGQNVSTWGTGDVVTSGVTSLDAAREATVSIAKAAIDVGDRVSFHELSPGGRIIPSAGGSRALVRLSVAMGTLGVRPPGDRTYRMPQVRPGSTVFVLSAFFHGPAAELANTMRAAGHRVIAIDTLPRSEQGGLSSAQRLAARTLFMERADVLADLRRTGVEVIAWGEDPARTSANLVAAGRRR